MIRSERDEIIGVGISTTRALGAGQRDESFVAAPVTGSSLQSEGESMQAYVLAKLSAATLARSS